MSAPPPNAFFQMTVPRLPSASLGENVGWCTMDLHRRPEWRNSFCSNFILCYFIGVISAISQKSSLSWWPSKVRRGCPWSVSLRAFDWQTAELLFAGKAAAVCLACAKTLYVDHFSGILAGNLCFSNLLRNVQSEHVSGPPLLDISQCGESAFGPPPTPLERCQQSFTYIPRKTCWDDSVTTQGVTSVDKRRK